MSDSQTCPFCGGEMYPQAEWRYVNKTGKYVAILKCVSCGAKAEKEERVEE